MKILLVTDGSEGALDAAHFLARFEHRHSTHIHILTVQEEDMDEAALPQEIFSSMRSALGCFPGHVTTGITHTRRTTSRIVERIQVAAEMLPADLVVTGSRGNGNLARFLLGSVATGVVRHSPCSVLLGRAPDGPMDRIIVGIDDSEESLKIVQYLSHLPIPITCEIHLVCVVMPSEIGMHTNAILPESLRREIHAIVLEAQKKAEQRLSDAAHELRKGGWLVSTELRHGDPAAELLEVIRRDKEDQDYGADMLVVGTRRKNTAENYLFSSISSRVVERAQCSVLVVRT